MERCIIRSERIVKECSQYIFIGDKLKHAQEQGTEIESAKGKAHGDIAIAAGCAWLGVTDVTVRTAEVPAAVIPAGCFLDRQNKAREQSRFERSGMWGP